LALAFEYFLHSRSLEAFGFIQFTPVLQECVFLLFPDTDLMLSLIWSWTDVGSFLDSCRIYIQSLQFRAISYR